MINHNQITNQSLSNLFEGWETDAYDFDAHMQHLLAVGRHLFDLEIAIISHIENETYTVKHCLGGEMKVGDQFELGVTYCSVTMLQHSIFTVSSSNLNTYMGHPCYQNFELKRYMGIPLILNGQPYGTLNFSSKRSNTLPFLPTHRVTLKLIAEAVCLALKLQDQQQQSELNTLPPLPQAQPDRTNQ